MHQPAVPDWGQNGGEGKVRAQNLRTQIALRDSNGVAWAKRYGLECMNVLAQRNFGARAAVEIIEDGPRQTPLGHAAQIVNVDDTRW
jgi:hypothetical protein